MSRLRLVVAVRRSFESVAVVWLLWVVRCGFRCWLVALGLAMGPDRPTSAMGRLLWVSLRSERPTIAVGRSLWVLKWVGPCASVIVGLAMGSRCGSVAVGWSRVSRCGLVALSRLLWVGRYSHLLCVGCCESVAVSRSL